MIEIIYFYGAGSHGKPRCKVFRDPALAEAFHKHCITAGIPIRLAPTTYHCKVDGRTREVVREWTSTTVTKEAQKSVSIFHNGETNGFGRSRKSAKEAHERAVASLDRLAAVA